MPQHETNRPLTEQRSGQYLIVHNRGEPIVFGRTIDERSGLDAFGADVAHMFRVLWRGKGLIVGALLSALALAVLFILLSTPLYLAKTQLLIDPRAKRVLQNEVVPDGLGSSSAGADALLVDSQVEIIGSDGVLRRVVSEKQLDKDPEFASESGLGPVARLRAYMGSRQIAAPPLDLALERLRRVLQVKRVGNTYVIEIGVLSREPEKAASIANAIADAYLSEQTNAASSSTRETAESLTARLAALRSNVKDAEEKVEAYRRQNNLIGAQGILVDEQSLLEMTTRATTARLKREEAQSRFEQAQRLGQLKGAGASTSDGLDDPAIANLRAQIDELDRARASTLSQLGPNHPMVRTHDAQRAVAKAQLDKEVRLAIERARSVLDVARRNETATAADLDRIRRRSLSNNDAQVKLRELQREADASKALLELVLTRAKQSSEQEDLSTANYRVLSRAVAAYRAAYPPTALVLAIALAIGLTIGCILAWLRESFRR